MMMNMIMVTMMNVIMETSMMINMIILPFQSQDREISTYLDPNVSVTPMAESHRSMGDTVYF